MLRAWTCPRSSRSAVPCPTLFLSISLRHPASRAVFTIVVTS